MPRGYSETKVTIYKQRLLDKKGEVLQSLGVTRETMCSGRKTYHTHMAESSHEQAEMTVAGSIACRTSRILTMVDAALARCEDGTFGICNGPTHDRPKKIPTVRLDAVPESPFCKECHDFFEARQAKTGR